MSLSDEKESLWVTLWAAGKQKQEQEAKRKEHLSLFLSSCQVLFLFCMVESQQSGEHSRNRSASCRPSSSMQNTEDRLWVQSNHSNWDLIYNGLSWSQCTWTQVFISINNLSCHMKVKFWLRFTFAPQNWICTFKTFLSKVWEYCWLLLQCPPKKELSWVGEPL